MSNTADTFSDCHLTVTGTTTVQIADALDEGTMTRQQTSSLSPPPPFAPDPFARASRPAAAALWVAAAVAGLFAIAGAPVQALAASTVAAAPTAPAAMAVQPAAKLPVVSIVAAQMREITETAIVSGTLVAREEIIVSAEIEGLAITEILVEDGDTVEKGQVLARLQRATLDTQLAQNAAQRARTLAAANQANAQIAEIQANLTEAGGSLERTRQLKDSGYTSSANFDRSVASKQALEARKLAAQSALTASQYDVASLDAQKREIEVRIARTEIKAPSAGRVSRRSAKVGAVATGVGEPMFRLIAKGEIELEAEISDVALPRVTAGLPVAVTPAGFAEPLQGAVRLVSQEVDRTTRLGKVRIALPADKMLPIGSFARGVVELGRRKGVAVPQSAVSFSKGGPSVQVLDQGQVRTRLVRLGLSGDGYVEVKSGLQNAEQVVARAGSFLRDGDKVVGVLEAAKADVEKGRSTQ